jgi:phenylalanyl-tRNA synthetase beta subunit
VVAANAVPWAAVERVASGVDKLISEVSYVDEYRESWVPIGHRSLPLRLLVQPTEATLTAEEIGVIRTRTLARSARNSARMCGSYYAKTGGCPPGGHGR